MVEAFSLRSAHCFQNALASQARLRHRVFVDRRRLPHETFGGMEYDAFDTPAAVYVVWRDEEREVRGLIRLLPTTRPYMLQTLWPELVDNGRCPASPDLWEITRVCVDKDLAPGVRRTVLPRLLCGVAEYFEAHGAVGMVGVTRPHLLEHFIPVGMRWLGPPAEVEGEFERAFMVATEHIRPTAHLARYGISGPQLRLAAFDEGRIAA